MELKHKEQKIRDLFVYSTNIMPVDIRIKRHQIIITVKSSDLEKHMITEEEIVYTIARTTGRKITLHKVEGW